MELQHRSFFAITERSGFEQHPGQLTLQPVLRGSTHPWDPPATANTYSSIAIITLLSLYASWPKPVRLLSSPMNLCRCCSWKLVLSSKGLVPSHSDSLLSPSSRKDVTSDPIKRCCSQESWLGLTLRKRQKFPVLPLLFCSCVSSFVLSACFY